MLHRPARWKVLVAAGLLLASAGAGIAWYEDDASDRAVSTTDAEPADPGSTGSSSSGLAAQADAPELTPEDVEGNVYKSFTGSFDSAPSSGSLDLRLDHGPVRVVGWDQPRYKVMVLQENSSGDGPSANDYETNVKFDDQSGEDSIDLSLVVDRDGTYGAAVQTNAASTEDPHRHVAVVAFVPSATSYEKVKACSGQEHMFEQAWEDSWGAVPWPWEDDRKVDGESGCVPTDDSPGFHVNIDARFRRGDDNETDHKPFGFRTGAADLQGQKMSVTTGHGDARLEGVDVSQLLVISGHGDLEVRDVSSQNATLLAGHGDVLVEEAEGADLTVYTDHGDVGAAFKPTEPGSVQLLTEHGEVAAELAPADGRAYDATAATDHGELTLELSDATVERSDNEDNKSWQDPSYWTGIFQEDETYEKTATAQTSNWESTAFQTQVLAATEHGDVVVTDDEADLSQALADDHDDEDEER